MRLTRSWYATPTALVLSMDLDIEGRTLRVEYSDKERDREFGSLPPQFIERQMRRDMMNHLEREIFK